MPRYIYLLTLNKQVSIFQDHENTNKSLYKRIQTFHAILNPNQMTRPTLIYVVTTPKAELIYELSTKKKTLLKVTKQLNVRKNWILKIMWNIILLIMIQLLFNSWIINSKQSKFTFRSNFGVHKYPTFEIFFWILENSCPSSMGSSLSESSLLSVSSVSKKKYKSILKWTNMF